MTHLMRFVLINVRSDIMNSELRLLTTMSTVTTHDQKHPKLWQNLCKLTKKTSSGASKYDRKADGVKEVK